MASYSHRATTPHETLAASPLAAVLHKAQVLETLESVLLPLFPSAVANNLRICHYEAGVLVVLVASPVWKAKLRMIKPDLIKKADQAGILVRDIEVRTVMALPIHRDRTDLELGGSEAARRALAEAMRLLESED